MWNLAVLLPLMIGDKVPNDDKIGKLLVTYQDNKICTARITSIEISNYLAALIKDHHEVFRYCYPAVSMTPKTHNLVHIPRLLKL